MSTQIASTSVLESNQQYHRQKQRMLTLPTAPSPVTTHYTICAISHCVVGSTPDDPSDRPQGREKVADLQRLSSRGGHHAITLVFGNIKNNETVHS